MAQAIFYISAGLLLYAYAIYPAMLAMLTAGRSEADAEGPNAAAAPSVSVIVAAYNESRVIGEKIANFLESEYSGSAEMIVISDGSTDRTAEIAEPFASSGRIRVIRQPERRGKGAAINAGASAASGEILVFTDANAMFQPGAISALARPFGNANIGLVTGISRYPDGTIGSVYQRYEQMLKTLESRLGSIAAADGAIYAMRKSLFIAMDPALINDFLHPILVSLKGTDSVMTSEAICTEDFSAGGEFARQVRMVSQAAMVYFRFLPRLVRKERWRSVAVLTSHKMLRWLTAPLVAMAVLSTLVLAPRGGIYAAALIAEVLFAAAAMAGRNSNGTGLVSKLSFAYQFVALNCAQAIGLWRCFTGQVPVVWEPRNL
ncbi:MAG TPA: glycosyltransferase [Candidatus Binataceae bacterium]|nr:glycosyltransferase [Candidatus Binataceae bacterium]